MNKDKRNNAKVSHFGWIVDEGEVTEWVVYEIATASISRFSYGITRVQVEAIATERGKGHVAIPIDFAKTRRQDWYTGFEAKKKLEPPR